MPTLDQLGQKVKAKYPGQYDDLSDADLGKKVQAKYPDAYKDFGGFSKPKSQTAAQRESKKRIADTGMEQGAAIQQTEAMAAKSKFAGEVAAMFPLAVAAPFTGGMSLAPALGLMTAAGAAGGGLRIATEAAGGSLPDSKKAVALTFAMDTASPVLGEGAGRILGAVTKGLIPKLLTRAAAKSEAGNALLQKEGAAVASGLDQAIKSSGKAPVDVSAPLQKAFVALDQLPKGKGPIGRQFSSLSPKAAEVADNIAQSLNVSGGGIGAKQPLEALVAMKGKINDLAWKGVDVPFREQQVFRQLAGDLDGIIKKELKAVGPEAEAAYQKVNWLYKVTQEKTAATAIAENWVKGLARRASLPAAGATIGYYRGHTAGSAAEGAAMGAALQYGVPAMSKLVLEQVFSHPEATRTIGKAIDLYVSGKSAQANMLAARAFAVAGSREVVKQAIEGVKEQTATPPQ